MKTVKFALNPHERKELRQFLGYLKRNYVAPASKLYNELEKSDKKFVGSFCFRSFLFWKTFENDKRRLDYEIKNALLEIEMTYKYVLSDGSILDDSYKYMYPYNFTLLSEKDYENIKSI